MLYEVITEWKSGWKEQHLKSGDEFDEEQYVEGNEPFFTDVKKSIKTKIVILLDHSSSIASDAIEYKKATLALCEVLSFLKVRFAVFAFSTENRSVVCWQIKADNVKWNTVSAKRLAQVVITSYSIHYTKLYDLLARFETLDVALTVYITFLYSIPSVALVPLIQWCTSTVWCCSGA